MTIMEALTWANNKLKNHHDADPTSGASLDSPMLDAQLLMSMVLNCSKSYLFTHFSQVLRDEQVEQFESLIERRLRHEPLAYILGWKEFYNRPFRVNPFVLIPRPDTEILIDKAIELSKTEDEDVVFLDVGTGSGAIAVTLAAETNLPVLTIDVSARALALAENNAKIHSVHDKVQFFESDLLAHLDLTPVRTVHKMILCANLPYLTTKQWETTQPEILEFEPRLALDGGIDGLEAYNGLFAEIRSRRAEFPNDLTILIEIDPAQSFSAHRLIEQIFPHTKPHVLHDLTDRPRIIWFEV